MSDFSVEFHTLAASCGWNTKAHWDHFLHELSDQIQDYIYSLYVPTSFDGLVDLTIQVENRHHYALT